MADAADSSGNQLDLLKAINDLHAERAWRASRCSEARYSIV